MPNYDKINLMCPTYRRSETNLPRFIESALDTCADANNLRFTFVVDESDGDSENTIHSMLGEIGIEHTLIDDGVIEPNLSYYYNKMYEQSIWRSDNTIVSMLGDDMIFQPPRGRSKHWDESILELMNLNEGKAVVYCDDGWGAGIGNKECIAVNLFTSPLIVDACQPHPFMAPEFRSQYIDTIWTHVAEYLGIYYYLVNDDLERPAVIYHDHCPMDGSDPVWERLHALHEQDHRHKALRWSRSWELAARIGKAIGITPVKELQVKPISVVREEC